MYFSVQAIEAVYTLGCTTFMGLGTIMEEAVDIFAADGNHLGMNHVYGEAKDSAHLMTKATATEQRITHLWTNRS